MCYLIVKMLTLFLIQQSDAFNFVGTYDFQDVASFMTNENRCGVIPWNISTSIKKEYSNTDEFCLVFLDSVKNFSAKSQINSVHVKYLNFGVQYNFKVDHSPCESYLTLQHVEMMLLCQEKTVLNGTICQRNEDCDRGKMEECQKHKDINLKICIPKRHVYESCNEYAQCEKNSKCMSSGYVRTCQCFSGYEEIDGQCVKMNLRLFESCSHSEQCTGSSGATKCKIVGEQQICYCPEGKEIIKGACLKAGLVLGDNCYINTQCTGTPNSGVCMIDHQDNATPICQCTSGFIRYGNRCLQVNKKLYEDCEKDDQCNGTSKEKVLVCKNIRHRKLCMCNSGFVEDNEYLKCRKAGKEIHTKCKINEQCTGTENANICVTNGKEENEEGVCRCNDQFGWIDGKCLKIGMKLFEPCVNNNQCNWTHNAGNCTEIGHTKLCYCQDGYLDFKGRCIKGLKRMHTNVPERGQSHSAFHSDVLLKEDNKKGGRKLYSSEVTLYTISCK